MSRNKSGLQALLRTGRTSWEEVNQARGRRGCSRYGLSFRKVNGAGKSLFLRLPSGNSMIRRVSLTIATTQRLLFFTDFGDAIAFGVHKNIQHDVIPKASWPVPSSSGEDRPIQPGWTCPSFPSVYLPARMTCI